MAVTRRIAGLIVRGFRWTDVTESGCFVAVLLMSDQGVWEISFARVMALSEMKEWRKWKAN